MARVKFPLSLDILVLRTVDTVLRRVGARTADFEKGYVDTQHQALSSHARDENLDELENYSQALSGAYLAGATLQIILALGVSRPDLPLEALVPLRVLVVAGLVLGGSIWLTAALLHGTLSVIQPRDGSPRKLQFGFSPAVNVIIFVCVCLGMALAFL